MEQRVEELMGKDKGLSREDAVTSALEEFGDASSLACEFSKIARMKRRRSIMRRTLEIAAVIVLSVSVTATACIALMKDQPVERFHMSVETVILPDGVMETQFLFTTKLVADEEPNVLAGPKVIHKPGQKAIVTTGIEGQEYCFEISIGPAEQAPSKLDHDSEIHDSEIHDSR